MVPEQRVGTRVVVRWRRGKWAFFWGFWCLSWFVYDLTMAAILGGIWFWLSALLMVVLFQLNTGLHIAVKPILANERKDQ